MKKPLLALAAAATLTVTPATVTPADAETVPADAADSSGSSSSLSSESELTAGEIIGITVGVLALVSAGAALAAQAGLLQIPGFDLSKLPTINVPGISPRPRPAATPNDCSPAAFDAIVPGWPNFTGTEVRFCDGQWAIAGAKQTDWQEAFHNVDGRWARLNPAGDINGFKCYDAAALQRSNAPQSFTDQVLVCR